MKLGRFIFLLVCLITVFNIFTQAIYASSPSSILVDVLPPNPSPGENTTINLNSYENNLDTVLITWSVDGKKSASRIGDKSFSITAPTAGSQNTVTATIALPDGDIEKTIIIKPIVMVLLWQANDSYVPPFYKGKAMPSPGSEVKVVAMPEIKEGASLVDSNNMTYAWQKDYTNNLDGSGYGKNFFLYTSDYLDSSNNTSVTASTVDQKYTSESSINIGTTNPKILFYINDINLGTIWDNTFNDGEKVSGNIIVQAVPYFISPKELLTPTLVWNWSINDNMVATPSYQKYLMPLQTQSGVSGTSTLRLDITSTDKVFEAASKEININF